MINEIDSQKELLLKEERIFLWEKYNKIIPENEDFFYELFPEEKLKVI